MAKSQFSKRILCVLRKPKEEKPKFPKCISDTGRKSKKQNTKYSTTSHITEFPKHPTHRTTQRVHNRKYT